MFIVIGAVTSAQLDYLAAEAQVLKHVQQLATEPSGRCGETNHAGAAAIDEIPRRACRL